MDNRRFIARRAAQYFNEGDTVNLGIGIPSACSDYVDPTIAFQTENGMIGVGPVAKNLPSRYLIRTQAWHQLRTGYGCFRIRYSLFFRCYQKRSYGCHSSRCPSGC